MTVTRRGMLTGAAAVAAATGLYAGSRGHGLADVEADLAALVPGDADVLFLTRAADGDADAVRRLGTRTGRTVVRPVAPLARAGFVDLAALIARARGVRVIAIADAAEMLVIDTLLRRAGATPVRGTAEMRDMLIARL